MMSSLGGCVQACAAFRTATSRPGDLDMVFAVEGEEIPVKLSGFSCQEVAGFESYGRLAFLSSLAFEDLTSIYGEVFLSEEKVAFIMVLPYPEERPLLEEYESKYDKKGDEQFFEKFFRLTSELKDIEKIVVQDSHAGVISAVNQAKEQLESGKFDYCIIGSADSYIDEPSQEWLYGTGQLKTPDGSDGLMPGEGASFLLLEKDTTAKDRNAEILAYIGPVATGKEDYAYNEKEFTPTGFQLSDALATVLETETCPDKQIDLIVNDLNGQKIRAQEYGNTLVRIGGQNNSVLNSEQWIPAISFGDVGAATGGFAICCVLRGFARNYVLCDEVIVCSASFSGLRGALSLKKSS